MSLTSPFGETALPGNLPFAVRNGQVLTRDRFWSDVGILASALPDRRHVLNLCEDRYLFCVVLLGALSRGQVCLLPPSGRPGVLGELMRDYPDSYLAAENPPDDPPCAWFPAAQPEAHVASAPPRLSFDRTAVIAFTSGSTGAPKACPHSLASFRTSARMAAAALGLAGRRLLVVSTTPPQHMYGLETSVFWPLFTGLTLKASRPFFPEDIRRTVAEAPLPCLLASTPTHLRAVAASGGAWTNLESILCSTAPLTEDLARLTETVTGCALREIYGSTETLSFASRRPAAGAEWTLYPGARLTEFAPEQFRLDSPHLAESMDLQDRFRLEGDDRFLALGRNGDMIKIGGKRCSLAELNGRLLNIPGVGDGVFRIEEKSGAESRTVALVAGTVDKAAILDGLRPYLDEVFLPRRIVFVDRIPRNGAGKIEKAELDALMAKSGNR